MSLMKWDPFQEISKLIGPIQSRFPYFRDFNEPRIDVYETDKEIEVTAEIPGLVSKNDITINVYDNYLEIKGEIKKSEERSDKNYHVSERFYGKFSRVIGLPAEVDKENAKAKYENGVLTIILPKIEPEKQNGKRIEIE